ncbi:hypothetical protein ACLOJK_004676 [Asimina triloba]
MTVSPRYDQYRDSWDTSILAEIPVGDRVETVRFFHCYKRGVDRVFVDHPFFLEKVWGKTGGKIYGPLTGVDYEDNQRRFSLLCRVSINVIRTRSDQMVRLVQPGTGGLSGPIGTGSGPFTALYHCDLKKRFNRFEPNCSIHWFDHQFGFDNTASYQIAMGEDVIFVANDWHTGPLPCYLKSLYQVHGMYKNAKVAFCIHNIAYQGRFAFSDFSFLNLPDQFKSSFDFIDGYDKPVKGRKINWMKAGILESDKVLTVSPNYAQEVVSSEDRGAELDAFLRKTCICGIVNGMDIQEWNPLKDKYISVKYDATTVRAFEVLDAKPLLKEALQAEVGLPVDRNIPLIGFIGRLEEQKGSDILAAAISLFIEEDVQIVVLGTGKKHMEKQLQELEVLYPNKARGVTKFNVPLAHMITAGADYMMVPSRFEPCGLIQLHAMRYGTIPIVASTGGLVDTVIEGFTGFHMGAFSVECDAVDPADVAAVATTVSRALSVYGTGAYGEMVRNCMAQDLSWKGPAKRWEEVLLGLGVEDSEPGVDGEEIAPLAKENVATP